jgi:hypothetical protein
MTKSLIKNLRSDDNEIGKNQKEMNETFEKNNRYNISSFYDDQLRKFQLSGNRDIVLP